ncbi:MAG: cytochrome c biogenesis protein CcdA [Spirochaetaceae bacterium]|nr:cytochrome c biogenesis protein CcdA [Spirochaetaceae bacterium]
MSSPTVFSALIAGLLSFLSPCVLPLIPAYISFISGMSTGELSNKRARGRVFQASLGFVLGFTLVFAVLGVAFSGGARMLQLAGLSRILDLVGGIVTILLGINFIFDFISFLRADNRLIGRFSGKKLSGNLQATLLGMSFALGWSPCIGPLLASILFMASQKGSAAMAFLLLLIYSAGLGIPFLLTGLFFDRAQPVLRFFKRHAKQVRILSGLILVLMGLSMAFGQLGSFPSKTAALGYRLSGFVGARPGLAMGMDLTLYALLLLFAAQPLLAATKAVGEKRPVPGRLSSFRIAIMILIGLLALSEILGGFRLLGALASWLGSGLTPRQP